MSGERRADQQNRRAPENLPMLHATSRRFLQGPQIPGPKPSTSRAAGCQNLVKKRAEPASLAREGLETLHQVRSPGTENEDPRVARRRRLF